MSKTHWFAGGIRLPGTHMPSNVMGDCGHKHRSPEAAAECIDRTTRALHSQVGGQNYYCDRIVMVRRSDGTVVPCGQQTFDA